MLTSELVVTLRDAGDVSILDVRGNVDSTTAGQLEAALRDAIAKDRKRFVFNLTDASYVTSVGWGVFISRLKALREGAGDILVCGMSPSVQAVYALMGMEKVIQAYPDEPSARQAFGQK